MFLHNLARLNRASCWRREVHAWGGRFKAATGDRLLYLWLHRLRLMGSDRAVIENQLRRGMTVLDIGANLGLYTYLLSRSVGEDGAVFSFEPDPDLFACLDWNCRVNGIRNATLHNVALGSKTETMQLSRSPFNAGDHRLDPDQKRAEIEHVLVSVRSLDDLLGGRKIDFIKIDVQGWEYEVFKGMRRTLERGDDLRIYFEFWPAGLRQAGCEPREVLALLTESRLRLHRIDGPRLVPIANHERLDESLRESTWINLLAIR